jgi:hypothetical protein
MELRGAWEIWVLGRMCPVEKIVRRSENGARLGKAGPLPSLT